MAYTQFDNSKPSASVNGTTFATDVRAQLAAIRDATFFGADSGWTYSQSGGTADRPTTMLFSKGTERMRYTLAWGTSGGPDGNVTSCTIAYSSNSGSSYDTIATRTPSYDANGNCTGGMPLLLLPTMMAMPGKLKSILATIAGLGSTYALRSLTLSAGTGIVGGGNLTANRTFSFDQSWGDGRYALRTRTISAGTGMTGGGDLSANRTLSFSTTWGDARYAQITGATFTGNIGVKTATHTEVDPGSNTINWTTSLRNRRSISANTTFTFTAPPGPANLLLKVINTSGSARTLTWPATVKWQVTPPAQPATTTGIYTFYYDGTTYWGSWLQGYANA